MTLQHTLCLVESLADSYGLLVDDQIVAVIELAEEVDVESYIPACLAKSTDATTWDGKNALVYGNIWQRE